MCMHVKRGSDFWHLRVVLSVSSSGSGVSPHPELPQGQMDSLLSIISSQRERFRSRNQELEAVSHDLSHTFSILVSFSGKAEFLICCVCFLCYHPGRKIAPCSRPCRPCRMNWTA